MESGEGRIRLPRASKDGEHHHHEVEQGMGVDMTTRGHSEDVVRTEPGITALKAWLYTAVGVM